MTLREEKKMVTEWMGWKENGTYHAEPVFKNKEGENVFGWNPQSDRNCWDKIWDNMNEETFAKYLTTVVSLMGFDENSSEIFKIACFAHTAKPAICWRALIKTIEES
ncbi:MAG: hypothetical protein GY861_04850 [bacterium]|nr:hypothetical protein [bacterium]